MKVYLFITASQACHFLLFTKVAQPKMDNPQTFKIKYKVTSFLPKGNAARHCLSNHLSPHSKRSLQTTRKLLSEASLPWVEWFPSKMAILPSTMNTGSLSCLVVRSFFPPHIRRRWLMLSLQHPGANTFLGLVLNVLFSVSNSCYSVSTVFNQTKKIYTYISKYIYIILFWNPTTHKNLSIFLV